VKLVTPAALGHVDVKVGTCASYSVTILNMKEPLLIGFEKDVSTKLPPHTPRMLAQGLGTTGRSTRLVTARGWS
jgi:hypothetical protein